MASLRIEKLQRRHAIDTFDCGREALNRFLIRYALQNQQAGASQTYVALADQELVGYYTLVVGQVEYNDAPERLTKGLARHPVPIMLLARLAVATPGKARASVAVSSRMRCCARFRPRTSPAFARLRFTRKTTRRSLSMSASILLRRRAIPTICSACLRISASFLNPKRSLELGAICYAHRKSHTV